MTSEVINIYSGSDDWVEATLSNFARTPFCLDGISIASMEGFHQGIKYQDRERRHAIFQYWGIKAKRSGSKANKQRTGLVYWETPMELLCIPMHTAAYRALYHRALEAKFTQHPKARAAILASGEARFSHIFPSGNGLDVVSFEATSFCQSLYKIRAAIKKKTS